MYNKKLKADLLCEIVRFETMYPEEYRFIYDKGLNPRNRSSKITSTWMSYEEDFKYRRMLRNSNIILQMVDMRRYITFVQAVIKCRDTCSMEIPSMLINLQKLGNMLDNLSVCADTVRNFSADSKNGIVKNFENVAFNGNLESVCDLLAGIKKLFQTLSNPDYSVIPTDVFKPDEVTEIFNAMKGNLKSIHCRMNEISSEGCLDYDTDSAYDIYDEEITVDTFSDLDFYRKKFFVDELKGISRSTLSIHEMFNGTSSVASVNLDYMLNNAIKIKQATELLHADGESIVEKYQALEQSILSWE